MTHNNVYKGIAAWMQALLQHSQSNTLGSWWNARTLECVNLGTELSVANELAIYKTGLDFTKALFDAAKNGSLTQSDVDYNVNKLLMIRWKFQNDFFHLEETIDVPAEEELTTELLTEETEEAIITFSSEMQSDVEDPSEPEVVAKPKGGRPKRVNK